jgi:predicted alpha-1,2-mannosidase
VFGFRAVAVAAGVALTVPFGAAAVHAATPPPLVADPAAYVNPFVGSTNLGNTYPGAVTPFGMLAFSPQTSRGTQISTPAPGGYQYTATRIRGFSLTHLSGVGCSGADGDIPIMPQVGDIASSPSADATDAVFASTFAHANESAKPGYYKVGLDSGAGATLTATPRTGFGQFSFPADKAASLLFRTSMSETGSADATVHIDPATQTVTGSVSAGNFCGPQSTDNSHAYYTLHFVAKLDQSFAATGTWTDATLSPGGTDASGGSGYSSTGRPNAGKGSGGFVTFAPGTTSVGVRVGISYVSEAGAAANLAAENTPLSFNAIAAGARSAWSARLKKIGIGGGTEAQKRTFYTALYHAQLEPTLTSDVDGGYMGADGVAKKLVAPQKAQYGTFSGWDVYRAEVQLLTLLDPKMASDFAQSLFNYATQRDGEWDRWLLQHGKTSVMSGDPSAAALAGMYAFGARDFDVHGAFDSLVHAATVPTANDQSDAGCNVECVGQRPALDKYLSLGYVPADNCHCWGGAAETLEDAAADYGLYQLGTALKDGRAPAFLDRSHNWRNVFDPAAEADPGLAHNIREQIATITASGDNAPAEGKAQAFDGDKGTKWLVFATTGWIQAQLKQPQTVTDYAITSANDEPGRDPADWTLQGSNDGSTWATVDQQSGQSWDARGETRTWQVKDPQPYLYYRLNVTANNGADIVQLAELELADPAVPTPVPADGAAKGWMRDRYADGHWAPGFSPSTGTGFVEGSGDGRQRRGGRAARRVLPQPGRHVRPERVDRDEVRRHQRTGHPDAVPLQLLRRRVQDTGDRAGHSRHALGRRHRRHPGQRRRRHDERLVRLLRAGPVPDRAVPRRARPDQPAVPTRGGAPERRQGSDHRHVRHRPVCPEAHRGWTFHHEGLVARVDRCHRRPTGLHTGRDTQPDLGQRPWRRAPAELTATGWPTCTFRPAAAG